MLAGGKAIFHVTVVRHVAKFGYGLLTILGQVFRPVDRPLQQTLLFFSGLSLFLLLLFDFRCCPAVDSISDC